MGFISLETLINNFKNKRCYVPLYQRNYKWSNSDKEKNGAVRLIKDIIDKFYENQDFNLGMIVTYSAQDGIQVLDGQQRLITLSLIMKALGKEDNWIQLEFERDPGFVNNNSNELPRFNYIFKNGVNETADVDRMNGNYIAIQSYIVNNCPVLNKNKLYEYIIKNVKILHHQTVREPIDEFLNMNFNKTPFCAADYVKADMIFDVVQNKSSESDSFLYKEEVSVSDIMSLWKKLQYVLYQLENVVNENELLENDMFQLIKQHYKHLDKNRMEILFEDRYYSDEGKVDNDRYFSEENPLVSEKNILQSYFNIMKNLLEELMVVDAEGKYHPNYTAYSAYNLLCKKKDNITFFTLFDDSDDIGQTLYNQFNLTEKSYSEIEFSWINVNQFMESMLISDNTTAGDNDRLLAKINDTKNIDLEGFESYKAVFDNNFKEFTEIIEAGKKLGVSDREDTEVFTLKNEVIDAEANNNFVSDESNDINKGNKITLRDLLYNPEIKKIKIPNIQRDYVMGSSGKYLESYLCKMRFEELCQRGELLLGNTDFFEKNEIEIDDEKLQITKLFKSNIISRYRNDLPTLYGISNFYTETDGWHSYLPKQGKYLPKLMDTNGGVQISKKERFQEVNEWRKILGFEEIPAPDNFRSDNCDELKKAWNIKAALVELIKNFNSLNEYISDTNKKVDYKKSSLKMNASCIMGHLDGYGTFWIYDGQQRITTSVILMAYAIKRGEIENKDEMLEVLRKFSFDGRVGANRLLSEILSGKDTDVQKLKKYIEDNTSFAIYKFWELMVEKGENDWSEYRKISEQFILDGIDFEFVKMEQAEDAEQLFMEMNEGLKLTPDEKYKAELSHIMNSIDYEKRREFSVKMDNVWLDFFGAENREVKYLQYCITMSYFEKQQYDAERRCESLIGLNTDILNLANASMDFYIKKQDISENPPTMDIDKIIKWIDTLENLPDESSYYRDRMILSKEDLVNLFDIAFRCCNPDTKVKLFAECMKILGDIRQEEQGAIVINKYISNKGDEETSTPLGALLLYRQDQYTYIINTRKWEDVLKGKFNYYSNIDVGIFKKDYESTYKVNYESTYRAHCKVDINRIMESIVNGINDVSMVRYIYTSPDKEFSITFDYPRPFKFEKSSDELISYIQGEIIRDNESQLNEKNQDTGQCTIRIKNEKLIELLNRYHNDSLLLFGIEKGYYKLEEEDGKFIVKEDRRNDDLQYKYKLPKLPLSCQNIKISNQYANLLYIFKVCDDESIKKEIRWEMFEKYINDPKKYYKYAYQVKKLITEETKNGKNIGTFAQFFAGKLNQNDEMKNIFIILKKEIAEKMGDDFANSWKKGSGIYNEICL